MNVFTFTSITNYRTIIWLKLINLNCKCYFKPKRKENSAFYFLFVFFTNKNRCYDNRYVLKSYMNVVIHSCT